MFHKLLLFTCMYFFLSPVITLFFFLFHLDTDAITPASAKENVTTAASTATTVCWTFAIKIVFNNFFNFSQVNKMSNPSLITEQSN